MHEPVTAINNEMETSIRVYLSGRFYTSVRFLLSSMIFLCVTIQYTQKIDLSTAIVCMTNHTLNTLQNPCLYCPYQNVLPRQHRFIGENKRQYILEAVGDGHKAESMPWMAVARSKAAPGPTTFS